MAPSSRRRSPATEPPSRKDITVDLHASTGKRWIQAMVESWASYYELTDFWADETLLGDIQEMADTYGPLLGASKRRFSLESEDSRILGNLIGDLVLAKALVARDEHAAKRVNQFCCEAIAEDVSPELTKEELEDALEEAVEEVRATLEDSEYDFVELPPSMADVAYVCVHEVMIERFRRLGREVPGSLLQAKEERESTLQERLQGFRKERIKQDRLCDLLDYPRYDECIRNSLLSLKDRQLLLLSLCYYENQRVPDSDVMEAMADIGWLHTRRGTPFGQGNIDKNLHDVLRRVLPPRLAGELAMTIDELVATSASDRQAAIGQEIGSYLTSDGSSPPRADVGKLARFCRQYLGLHRGQLIGEEIIRLCRALAARRRVQLDETAHADGAEL